MAHIRSLRPNVTREQAIEHFHSSGPARLARNLVHGPLRSVAEAYIPFRLFQVRIVNRGRTEDRILGLDAVTGRLDLYQFDHLPAEDETVCLETRNCPTPHLDAANGSALLIPKLRRLLYRRGFFRIRDLQISAEPLPGELYIPYWLAFRGRGGHTRLAVLDAVRRQLEGAKLRHLVEAWLLDVVEQ